jgi:hypothetical protein
MGAFAGAWQRLFEIQQTATAQDAAGSCTRVSHLPYRSNLPEASRQTIGLYATFSEGVEFCRLNIGYGFS